MRQKNGVNIISVLAGLLLIAVNLVFSAPTFAENFTIVPIPDTQYYSQDNPDTLTSQTQWIVANKDTLTIVYAPHLGALVQTPDSGSEWLVADEAMGYLEDPATTGLTDGIPFSVMKGNHDSSSADYYNTFFGISRFTGRGYYGGTYESDNDDNYVLFSGGGMDFIAINLSFSLSSRAAILSWADALLKT